MEYFAVNFGDSFFIVQRETNFVPKICAFVSCHSISVKMISDRLAVDLESMDNFRKEINLLNSKNLEI